MSMENGLVQPAPRDRENLFQCPHCGHTCNGMREALADELRSADGITHGDLKHRWLRCDFCKKPAIGPTNVNLSDIKLRGEGVYLIGKKRLAGATTLTTRKTDQPIHHWYIDGAKLKPNLPRFVNLAEPVTEWEAIEGIPEYEKSKATPEEEFDFVDQHGVVHKSEQAANLADETYDALAEIEREQARHT